MKQEATLICVTPVWNEAWILERFLQCASTWADYILIADQQSTDGSREIAQRFEKVVLIDNPPEASADERDRRGPLIEKARQLPAKGKRILIALDADEMFSANWMQSEEWKRILQAPPGTSLCFQRVNIGPNVSCAWIEPGYQQFGYVDDGYPYDGHGLPLHGPRLPLPEYANVCRFEDIKILHYQYTDWERMKSKHRWYQAWERITYPNKRPIVIYRQYHHMNAAIRRAGPVISEWLEGYEALGIDMRSVTKSDFYHWDKEVLKWLIQYGPQYFRKLDIWDFDWENLSTKLGLSVNEQLRDPRTFFEKAIHIWLRATQPWSHTLPVRAVQKLLQVFGW